MLESSLVSIGTSKSGGTDTPDPAASGDGAGTGGPAGGAGGGPGGGGGAGGPGKVAATERTRIVLACLFEALGAKRATREVARVLCTLSAGTAEGMAAAAAAGAIPGEAARVSAAAAAAAAAVAPPALLPVLASLPERCTDIVGLALEVLETGQAAADALAREGGVSADRAVVFGSVDAAGR